MPDEWPIARRADGQGSASPVTRPASGDRRLATVLQDFFLPARERLTEQERALMTAMLHGLIERIADEIRARLEPAEAEQAYNGAAELVSDLSQAGLLQRADLAAILLRRADIQRLAAAAPKRRSQLQRWTASDDAGVASAAMTVLAARGRGCDRFGRAILDISDLPRSLAADLAQAVAAAMGARSEINDETLTTAAERVTAEAPTGERWEELDCVLAIALGESGRRHNGLLLTLAEEREAPLMAAILGVEARIPNDDAWEHLLGGGLRLALLLRMAEVARPEAAALLGNAGPEFGIGDVLAAIEYFDALSDDTVHRARCELRLPPVYRQAKAELRHG